MIRPRESASCARWTLRCHSTVAPPLRKGHHVSERGIDLTASDAEVSVSGAGMNYPAVVHGSYQYSIFEGPPAVGTSFPRRAPPPLEDQSSAPDVETSHSYLS